MAGRPVGRRPRATGRRHDEGRHGRGRQPHPLHPLGPGPAVAARLEPVGPARRARRAEPARPGRPLRPAVDPLPSRPRCPEGPSPDRRDGHRGARPVVADLGRRPNPRPDDVSARLLVRLHGQVLGFVSIPRSSGGTARVEPGASFGRSTVTPISGLGFAARATAVLPRLACPAGVRQGSRRAGRGRRWCGAAFVRPTCCSRGRRDLAVRPARRAHRRGQRLGPPPGPARGVLRRPRPARGLHRPRPHRPRALAGAPGPPRRRPRARAARHGAAALPGAQLPVGLQARRRGRLHQPPRRARPLGRHLPELARLLRGRGLVHQDRRRRQPPRLRQVGAAVLQPALLPRAGVRPAGPAADQRRPAGWRSSCSWPPTGWARTTSPPRRWPSG